MVVQVSEGYGKGRLQVKSSRDYSFVICFQDD